MNFIFPNYEDSINNVHQREKIYNPYDLFDNHFNDISDNSIYLEETKSFRNYKTFNNLGLNKVEDFKISPYEEKSTAYITKVNKLQDNKPSMNKEIRNQNSKPEYFSFDDIKTKIFEPNRKLFKFNFQEMLKKDIVLENFLNKKRKRHFFKGDNNINVFNKNEDEDEDEDKYKKNEKRRGRPKQSKNGIIHNRMSKDNIFKKIKSELFNHLVKFINILLDKSEEDEDRILNLDYKYINQLKKEKDLEYLNMSLKEFLSMDISCKYKHKSKDLNKKNIEKILDDKKDNDIIQFAFNMTFRDYLNIFTRKINVYDLIDNLDQNTKIKIKVIDDSLQGVELLLNKIAKNNNSKYFSSFCIFLYNYELWFYNKQPRTSKPKKVE